VVSSSPQSGATSVGLLTTIMIKFSEDMDATTINAGTITMTGGTDADATAAAAPAIEVEYVAAERVALCTPDSTLAGNAAYAVTCSQDVTDAAGNGLATPWTLPFTTGPADCDHLADRLEPNDIVTKATPVRFDSVYRNLTNCEDDLDLFSIVLTDTSMVTVTHNARDAGFDNCVVELTREDGEWYTGMGYLASVAPQSFHYSFLPGTYYAHVYASNEPNYLLYDLDFATGEPCVDDGFEDNDFPDEAKEIAYGTTTGLRGCFTDADWYSTEAMVGQTLTVTLRNEPFTGRDIRRLTIRDPSGSDVVEYDGAENPLTRSHTTSMTGTYLIAVRYWEDGVEYRLTVNLTD
jgi:hypothetical protein